MNTNEPKARHASLRRYRPPRIVMLPAILLIAIVGLLGSSHLLQAQSGGYGTHRFDFYQPGPPAVAQHFPYVYAGKPILKSALVDEAAGTVTLPLYQGQMVDGRTVWYVLTDVSDAGIAESMGINYAPKLRNVTGKAVRTATLETDGSLTFDQGAVDFTPERVVVPGEAPNFFPPKEAAPGAVGDADYSPLVRVTNAGDIVYNASVVAFDVDAAEIEFPDGDVDYSKVVDRAVAISPAQGTVTLTLALGTADARAILFISLDSNSELVSALEASVYAPALSDIPVGKNDTPQSAVAANYIIANGPVGADNPQGQGLNSALSDNPTQVLDIFDGAPGVVNDYAYSPMWDLYVAAWTPEAVEKGYTSAIYSELQFLGLVEKGWLTTPNGDPMGPSGLISNCALIMHY